MITSESMKGVQVLLDRIQSQGKQLFDDISETAADRERLLKEAEDRERVIEKLNGEINELRETVTELEARNDRLSEDAIRLENDLNDATARLATIREASNGQKLTPARNGTTEGGKPSDFDLSSLRRPKIPPHAGA